MSGKRVISIEQRFWNKVEKSDYCWNWKASTFRNGYAQFHPDKNSVLAHRFAYELVIGKIPQGMTIDHLCRNRSCVNPAHMEIVTRRENILRGEAPAAIHARKTHCPKGHALPETRNKLGQRICKTCRMIGAREYRKYFTREHKNHLNLLRRIRRRRCK